MRALVSTAILASAVYTVTAKLAPKAFLTLPLGTVKPAGWLHDQLQVQTDGIAGHMHEFYDLVSKTDWIGGDSYYSYLEEAGSYWFNAMVPNGILMNHSVINEKTQEFLDYVLQHQDAAGWLGPEVGTDKLRYLWGRLYDNHPNGQEDLLIDTMVRLKWSGAPWERVFSEELFPRGPVEGLPNPFGKELYWHGVNLAEGLKALPATYRFTHNSSDLKAASLSWDLLYKYHGRPSGAFGADEMLAGLEANRGSELCLVVEAMFSGSYLYQVIGDLKFADQVERMAYNALPATITANMWGRQYLQQQNQIAAKNMTPNPFPEDGPDSNIFGLEPNYPLELRFLDLLLVIYASLGAALLTFHKAGLNSSRTRSSLLQTKDPYRKQYRCGFCGYLVPFGDTLRYHITAQKDFDFYIRVASWVVNGSISINDGATKKLSPSKGLHKVNIKKGDTTLLVQVPARITIESRPHGSVAIHRGPLNYAFDSGYQIISFPVFLTIVVPSVIRTETVLKVDPRESRAVDLQYDAAEDWEYAIDPTQLTYQYNPPESGKLPSPIFESGRTPSTITAGGDTFAASPPEHPSCIGPNTVITLSPFGTTKLRISEFPVVDLIQNTLEDRGPQVPMHL
ncbi:hypothetical protein VNI00_000180 [Paramarasmius palmivorus]|uniref:Uncharacterized protein n=1 Tax=Paramarasmius palmivorus TaxID=297713 RepID=A0AAW0EES9_9AGAR